MFTQILYELQVSSAVATPADTGCLTAPCRKHRRRQRSRRIVAAGRAPGCRIRRQPACANAVAGPTSLRQLPLRLPKPGRENRVQGRRRLSGRRIFTLVSSTILLRSLMAASARS